MATIKISDVPQNFMNIVVGIFRGKNDLSVYPKDEELVILPKKEYNEFLKLAEDNKTKATLRANLKSNLRAIQEDVVNSGVAPMSMDEINAEIRAYRQEKRGLK